jgi:TPR repeat protein
VTRLLKVAAGQSHPDAQYLIACQKKGVNSKKKVALLKDASKCNNINAIFKLACMLADGEEVAREDKEAATLFMSAVSKGHVESHCRRADLFEQGKGVAQSSGIAAMLYGLAAEKKSVCALWNLSRMYKHGHGVIQSHSEAYKFCRLSAVQGFAQAKYDLACMYEEGFGTTVPLVRSEAVRWFSQAAAKGHQAAAAALERLSNFDTVIAQPESHLNARAPVVSA